MKWFWKSDIEGAIERAVKEVMRGALVDTEAAIGKVKKSFDLTAHIAELQQQVQTLTIEKSQREEAFARRERELEHKVGLERKRQAFEIDQAKREAFVGVREENLKADRNRFDEQLKFHEDRFSTEVGYLKEILGDMMKRLPSVEHSIKEKR